jgi:hypothetical protein
VVWTGRRDRLDVTLCAVQRVQLIPEAEMSNPRKVHLERLPKRDAVARLRAAYACLEQGWRIRRRAVDRQTGSRSKQEEKS